MGLIGMPGSGKGECAKFAREAGITVLNMGDLVREHAKSLNLEMNDENIGSVAHSEREKFGFGIWATRTLDKINELNLNQKELIIIDGIRGGAEVSVFRDTFGEDFKTIALKISAARRFELLKLRNRSDAPITDNEFKARDAREATWGIQEALDEADYVLYNTETLEMLKTSFIELLDIIKNQEKDSIIS
jgi:dephospho-CoA kinase